MKTACIPICFVVLAIPSMLYAQDRPEALERLEARRMSLETAHIEWSRTKPGTYGGYHPRFFTTRLAGEDIVNADRGDEDGVFRGPQGISASKRQCNTMFTLMDDGETWYHEDRSWSAEYFPGGGTCPHLRAVGLSCVYPWWNVQETLWRDSVDQPNPRKYSERDEGDYHVVEAETDVGKYEWWLDPQKGGEPVRILIYSKDGEVMQESRSTFKNYEGVWFPESVAYFARSHKDGKEPYETINIHYASFNQPEHPRSLGPQDIGIEAGVHIQTYAKGHKLIAWNEIYDGEKIVSDQEYLERRKRGEIKLGPTMQREAAKDHARESAKLAGDEASRSEKRNGRRSLLSVKDERLTEWEEYTRRFIARYQLNDDQTQKAWLVCLECQAQARGHLAKIKSRLGKLENRLKTQREVGDKAADEQLIKLEEQRRDLLQPITGIFERQLKPRLEKLPTRAQRKAVQADDKE